ncbi:MAG: hypothetical protein ACK4ND_04170 [Cytophagaceae bacterium]
MKISYGILILTLLLASCGTRQYTGKNNKASDDLSGDPVIYSLTRAISADPDNSSLFVKRGEFYLEKGKPRHALKDAEKAVQKEEDFYSCYLLAKSYFALNKFSEAVEAGLNAEKHKTNHAELTLLISRAYLKEGDRVKADTYLAKAEKMVPEHAEIKLIKGLSAIAKKDTINALVYLNSGLKKDGSNIDIIKELVNIYIASGKLDTAMTLVIAGQNISPEDPVLLFSKSRILEKNGLVESAIFACESALLSDPDYIPANKRMAEHYFALNNFSKAKEHSERVMAQDSSYLNINHMLGKIYEKEKLKREAVIVYKNILSRNSGDTTAQNALARIYAGNPELAPVFTKKVQEDSVEVKIPVVDVPTPSVKVEPVKKDTVAGKPVVAPIKKESPVLEPKKVVKKDTAKKELTEEPKKEELEKPAPVVTEPEPVVKPIDLEVISDTIKQEGKKKKEKGSKKNQ